MLIAQRPSRKSPVSLEVMSSLVSLRVKRLNEPATFSLSAAIVWTGLLWKSATLNFLCPVKTNCFKVRWTALYRISTAPIRSLHRGAKSHATKQRCGGGKAPVVSSMYHHKLTEALQQLFARLLSSLELSCTFEWKHCRMDFKEKDRGLWDKFFFEMKQRIVWIVHKSSKQIWPSYQESDWFNLTSKTPKHSYTHLRTQV